MILFYHETFSNFVLVPCAPGRYYRNDECVKCDFGTYQDLSAQLSCKECPDGTTTPGRESRSVTECSIKYDTELNGTRIIIFFIYLMIQYTFSQFLAISILIWYITLFQKLFQ